MQLYKLRLFVFWTQKFLKKKKSNVRSKLISPKWTFKLPTIYFCSIDLTKHHPVGLKYNISCQRPRRKFFWWKDCLSWDAKTQQNYGHHNHNIEHVCCLGIEELTVLIVCNFFTHIYMQIHFKEDNQLLLLPIGIQKQGQQSNTLEEIKTFSRG